MYYLVVSFFQIMRVQPGFAEREPQLTYTISHNDSLPRFCEICERHKPDRAHHCHICKKCILRMDHHCPWVFNCVGLKNHKLFILFNLYGTLYCIILFASLLFVYQNVSNYNFSLNMELNIFMGMVASGLFGVALLGFFILHLNYAFRNQTSMESLGYPRTRFTSRSSLNIFDLGYFDNLKAVFGDQLLLWFLPTSPKLSTDGYVFEINSESRRLFEDH
eukprot:NODE_165_length_14629_cov_0.605231.p7 type:complete len:219 gc:universal NODE_165_length_14629_cov_0.605231:7885-8541(+)